MRLVERTKPLPSGTMVYRGEGFDSPQALLERAKVFLESGGQVLRPLVASASVNAGGLWILRVAMGLGGW